MPNNDEVVRLILDADATKVEDARRTITATTSDTYEFAQSIEHLSGESYELADHVKFLDVVMTDLDKSAKRVVTSNDSAAASMHRLAGATEKAKSGAVGMGQSMLQSGRFIQDFAQGGIGGVLNNIEGLTVALGMGSGLAGILTIVGVAAALAGPKLIEFGRTLFETRNAVPTATDSLKYMEEQLKNNTKALDELRDKTSLSNDELKRFNELTAESARLEAQAAEEKQRRKDLEAFAGLKSDREKEEASDFTKAIQQGGPGEAARVKAELKKALDAQAEYHIKEAERRMNGNLTGKSTDEQLRMFQDQADYAKFLRQDKTETVNDLVRRAMNGDTRSINEVAGLAQGGYGANLIGFANRLGANRQATSERASAADVREAEQHEKGVLDEVERRKKDKAKADKEWADHVAEVEGIEASGTEADRKERERAAAKERQHMRPIVAAQLKEEDAFAQRTGLVDQAGYRQAQLQSQGLSGDAAYERTQGELQRHLTQRYGVGEEEAFGLSHRITGTAHKQDQDKYQEAYARAIANGADVNQAMIYANDQLLQTLAAATARFAGQAAALRSQGSRAGAMRVKGLQNFPPGGGNGF